MNCIKGCRNGALDMFEVDQLALENKRYFCCEIRKVCLGSYPQWCETSGHVLSGAQILCVVLSEGCGATCSHVQLSAIKSLTVANPLLTDSQ